MAPLVIESWTWYGVASSIFIARVIARILKLGQQERLHGTSYSILKGLRNLRLEDYLMAIAFSFYTAEVVTMNITAKLNSNLLPPGYLDDHTMSQSEIDARRFGSIMTNVVEQCQICAIWLIKICVLLMWYGLTNIAYKWRHRLVVCIGIYVIFTWAFMETFYFAVWCRPFSNYWAVPTPNPKQCAAAWNHLITNAVFNLTSDLLLLGISISIAFESNFRGARRLGFISLCSLGLFVIICAILNKAYSWQNPYGSEWTYWYIRESSTAVILSNVPYAWQLVKRLFNIRDNDTKARQASQISSNSRGSGGKGDNSREMSRMPSYAETPSKATSKTSKSSQTPDVDVEKVTTSYRCTGIHEAEAMEDFWASPGHEPTITTETTIYEALDRYRPPRRPSAVHSTEFRRESESSVHFQDLGGLMARPTKDVHIGL